MQHILRMYQGEYDSDGHTLYYSVSLVVLPPHRSVESELQDRLDIALQLYDSGLAFYKTDTRLDCTHRNNQGVYDEIVEYLFTVPSGCSNGWIKHMYRELYYHHDVEIVRG